MKLSNYFKVIAAILTFVLASCGSSSSEDKNNGNGVSEKQKNSLNWESVPSDFNPQVFEENFKTNNINRIFVDMFGFNNDVEVVYSGTLAQGQGYLKIYSVFKESGSRGSFSSSISGQNLELNRYGTYQCSIKIENRNITQLKGFCFVKIEVYLPTGSEIEVYNLKKLISRRFIPIDSETFIKNFKNESFADGKKATIEDYISSYNGMNKLPQLTAVQLGIIVDGFSFKEDQFDVLRKLHTYVSDRHNLNAMIEKEISHFDRDEAKRICGL